MEACQKRSKALLRALCSKRDSDARNLGGYISPTRVCERRFPHACQFSCNQLTSASKSGVSASYLYDPIGRQAQKTVGSTKTRFIYDDSALVADYDTSGNLVNRYVHGGMDEAMIQITAGGTVSFFHHDNQNSVVAITDNAGAITNQYAYSPWGETSSLSGTPFGYTGQRHDAETGLHYYKARYLSSSVGRFLQCDPIGYAAGLNLLGYVGNDPLNNCDPSGLVQEGTGDGFISWMNPNADNENNPLFTDDSATVYAYALGFVDILLDWHLPTREEYKGWMPGDMVGPNYRHEVGKYVEAVLLMNPLLWDSDPANKQTRDKIGNAVRHSLAAAYLHYYGVPDDFILGLGYANEWKEWDNDVKKEGLSMHVGDTVFDVMNNQTALEYARRNKDYASVTKAILNAGLGMSGHVLPGP